MLWELSVAEQRYCAVLEAGAGVRVTEVAERYGVSRQSVPAWLVRYQQEGSPGLGTAVTVAFRPTLVNPAALRRPSFSAGSTRTDRGGLAVSVVGGVWVELGGRHLRLVGDRPGPPRPHRDGHGRVGAVGQPAQLAVDPLGAG
jgi:hypothetical protein